MLPNLEPPINDLRLLNYLLNVKLNSSQDKDIIQTLLFQKSINNGYVDKFKNELKVHQTRQNRNLIGMFNYQNYELSSLVGHLEMVNI